jgi:hypothetical protein
VIAAICAGAAIGLGTALISEVMLRFWMSRPAEPAMKIMLRGLLLRSALVLSALVVVLARGWFDEAAFVGSLFVTYLAAQVWEGFRYQRFIHSR